MSTAAFVSFASLILASLSLSHLFPSVPIPGGCNIEFPLEISPFLYLRPTDLLLVDYLEFQRAAIGNETNEKRMCGPASYRRLSYQIYAYYGLASADDEIEYFHRLTLMSNRDWVTEHATLVGSVVLS